MEVVEALIKVVMEVSAGLHSSAVHKLHNYL